MERDGKIILFGSGQIGKKALSHFGRENVYCFADNNIKLVGSTVEDVPVISFDRLKEIYQNYRIVISMDASKSVVVAAQLEEAGIKEYTLFLKLLASEQGGSAKAAKTESHMSGNIKEAVGKNVLMVAYHFPPIAGSGVFRPLKFAKYLPQFRWKPVVFAADRPRTDWSYIDQSLLDEVPDNVDVIRITDPVGTMQKMSLLDEKDVLLPFVHEVLKGDPEAEEIFSAFLQSKTGIVEMMVFPCAALLWAYYVVQYIEKNLDIRKFHAIYTTAEPYSSHLVGYYLKEKYGLPWLADYRDPWTGNPEPPFDLTQPRGKLIARLEHILLNRADCNITLNTELVQDYKQRLGLTEKKIACITNGYDEADFAELKWPEGRTKYFTINYSGILYINRSIDAILQALRQLFEEGEIDPNFTKLRIVGDSMQYDPKEVAKRFGLESIICETGYISHQEALQSNMESNMLLLLVGDDEKYKIVYTGKIFDYLRSGRPILALGPKGGAVDRTLCDTGHGETYLSTQIPEIKAMILREYRKWQTGQSVSPVCSPKIKQFERKHLTAQLVELLDKVAGAE